MEKEAADIAQISFYLAKGDATFDSVIDPEAGLEARRPVKILLRSFGTIDAQFAALDPAAAPN
jgi:hypothetical protein